MNAFFSLRVFCLAGILFLGGECASEERCSAEVKLLLSTADIPATVLTLKAKKESAGKVYFFDTDGRDLLAQGVIVRLRSGSSHDLTVKLRLPGARSFEDPSSGREDFKCEVDRTGDDLNRSYSLTKKFTEMQVPSKGNDIYRALSDSQRQLLSAAHVNIDWDKVRRVADITATDWTIRSDSSSRKLTLELWKWSGGAILELSAKTDDEKSDTAYAELRQAALDRQLKLTADQRSKTRIALLSNVPSVIH